MTIATFFTRRGLIALSFGAMAALGAGGAFALSTSEAETFVDGVVVELRTLIQNDQGGSAGAAQFLDLLERKGAVEDVARFAVGRAWRDMTPAQQTAYQQAFHGYISRTYQKRFGEYGGEDIAVTGAQDVGAKGVLVKSTLKRPNGVKSLVEWLVTDRGGDARVADVIFEGVSLAITLRETFGGMIDKRNGDIDSFIAELNASGGV